jgi:hypothetical protein
MQEKGKRFSFCGQIFRFLAQSNYFLTQLKDVKVKGDSTEIFYDKGKNFNETFIDLSIL